MTFGVDGGRFAAVGHGLDVMVLGAAGKGGSSALDPKVRSSEGCGGSGVLLAVECRFDCHGFEGYLGNVRLVCFRKENSCSSCLNI